MFRFAHLERVKDPRWNTGNTWVEKTGAHASLQLHTHTHSRTLIFHLFYLHVNTKHRYLSDKIAENSCWCWTEAQIALYMPSVPRNESITWSLLHHGWGVKKDRWSLLQPLGHRADIAFTTRLGPTPSYYCIYANVWPRGIEPICEAELNFKADSHCAINSSGLFSDSEWCLLPGIMTL